MAASLSGKGAGALYKPLAEINVTPLVDVMLVLLIVFMITAPMLAAGLKVDLPQAKQAQPLKLQDPVVITVAKDGRLLLGNDEITKDALIEAIRAKLGDDNARVLRLRGDKLAPYGDVIAVMDLLAANGLTHIAMVADARDKPQSESTTPAEAAPSAPIPPAPAPAVTPP
ncbi:MAG: biopolymer transporter ExbD [Roseiarcus sp.]|jgi:biopolymer transport protein ExbD